MTQLYVGLDVSLEQTAISIVDQDGGAIFDGQAMSDPDVVAEALRCHGNLFAPIGIEAGPLTARCPNRIGNGSR